MGVRRTEFERRQAGFDTRVRAPARWIAAYVGSAREAGREEAPALNGRLSPEGDEMVMSQPANAEPAETCLNE